jgi:hypothetical protein
MSGVNYRFLLVLMARSVVAEIPVFYVESDHIETVDTNSFLSNIINSDRISVVECMLFYEYFFGKSRILKGTSCFVDYANWCGYSKKFRVHYKQLANETKLWNKYVRIAAIDCGFEELNGDLCWKNNFPSFPTFKFYPGN